MENWFVNKNEFKDKLKNSIMIELESLIDSEDKTANYWIDGMHNVFAFINDNGNNDRWIEIHYELYDCNEEIIGDLIVLSTDSVNKRELSEQVEVIVNTYCAD